MQIHYFVVLIMLALYSRIDANEGVRTTAIHAVATVLLSVLPDFVNRQCTCQDAKLGRNQAYASAGPFVECRVERGCW